MITRSASFTQLTKFTASVRIVPTVDIEPSVLRTDSSAGNSQLPYESYPRETSNRRCYAPTRQREIHSFRTNHTHGRHRTVGATHRLVSGKFTASVRIIPTGDIEPSVLRTDSSAGNFTALTVVANRSVLPRPPKDGQSVGPSSLRSSRPAACRLGRKLINRGGTPSGGYAARRLVARKLAPRKLTLCGLAAIKFSRVRGKCHAPALRCRALSVARSLLALSSAPPGSLAATLLASVLVAAASLPISRPAPKNNDGFRFVPCLGLPVLGHGGPALLASGIAPKSLKPKSAGRQQQKKRKRRLHVWRRFPPRFVAPSGATPPLPCLIG